MKTKPQVNMIEVIKNFRQIRIEHAVHDYKRHVLETYELRPHHSQIIESAAKEALKNCVKPLEVREVDPNIIYKMMSG